jgi:hypothetical protein
MTWNQNQQQSPIITMWNKAFENISKYKYLGTILTNRYKVHNEIRWRSKSAMLVITYF